MLNALFIYYDNKCGLCSSAQRWLLQQPSWLRLYLIPSDSERARAYLDKAGIPKGELAVVSDEGSVYLGHRAWLMCLYGLREYHRLACRLSAPLLMPFARSAFELVSKNRAAVSWLAGMKSDSEAAQRLARDMAPVCDVKSERWLE